ncbi:MAG: hypothetical protein DRO23_03005 [Thermoprotei archaeon]|nr:MAG: hypothetical protein DRO23_03005 [Thermoprotei archaeon]
MKTVSYEIIMPVFHYKHRFKPGVFSVSGCLLKVYHGKKCRPCYVMVGTDGDKVYVFSSRRKLIYTKLARAKIIHEWSFIKDFKGSFIEKHKLSFETGYEFIGRPLKERDLCISKTSRIVRYPPSNIPDWLKEIPEAIVDKYDNVFKKTSRGLVNATAVVIPNNMDLILKFAVNAHHFP